MAKAAKIPADKSEDRGIPEPTNTTEPGKGDNIVPVKRETFLHWVARHVDHEAQVKKLADKKNLMRREMKNAGIDCGEFDAVRKMMSMDDETISLMMQQQIRYAQFLNLPIGTQLQFVDDAQPPAETDEELETKAANDGWLAGMTLSHQLDECPHPEGPQAQAWQKGWYKGQEVLAKQLKSHNAEITIA